MSNIEPKKRDFEMLNNEVIEPGYCVSCGGCEAVCPVYVISIEQLKPKLVGDCISCGACIDICLRFKQKVEQPTYPVDDIGPILEIYTGKTNNEEIHSRSQNGGIVTILLLTAMKKGKIDSSLVTTHGSDLLSPVPMLALSEFDIRKSSRSKYTLNPVLIKLSSIKLSNKKKVAIVGLPCHNETLANIMDMKNLGADFRVKYKIGLFCMSSYDPVGFRDIVSNSLGIFTPDLAKTDCARGKFFFEHPDGTTEIKIKECGGAKAEGCKYCQDFAAEFTDISIGNVGVGDDSNIILIRTKAGKELFEFALKDNLLDVKKIDESKWEEALAPAVKLSSSKRKGARALARIEPA